MFHQQKPGEYIYKQGPYIWEGATKESIEDFKTCLHKRFCLCDGLVYCGACGFPSVELTIKLTLDAKATKFQNKKEKSFEVDRMIYLGSPLRKCWFTEQTYCNIENKILEELKEKNIA